MVRVPELCNDDRATTVLAHVRQVGVSGAAFKGPDILGAYACYPCHMAIDGHTKTPFTREELRLMHLEGMVRTIDYMIHTGILK